MTRQQDFMTQALTHVRMMAAAPELTKKTYGSLCHAFPIMVRQSGLCQTMSFIEEKANGDNDERAGAYRALRGHIADALGAPDVLERVRTESAGEYLHDSRTLIEAWVFYKRFATSILDVKAGEGDAR